MWQDNKSCSRGGRWSEWGDYFHPVDILKTWFLAKPCKLLLQKLFFQFPIFGRSNCEAVPWNEDILLWSFRDTKAKKSTINTRRWMALEGWPEYYHTLARSIVHWRKGKYIIQKISYFLTPCTLIFLMHWCINTSNLFTLPLDNYHNRILVNCIVSRCTS